ncbi:MAG: hypothetical protein DRJ47_03925 [Thermoprotei archaeon]|nr:MAG: hypothetical protein DRJ47_03925 [Thermoprotei archaeon]
MVRPSNNHQRRFSSQTETRTFKDGEVYFEGEVDISGENILFRLKEKDRKLFKVKIGIPLFDKPPSSIHKLDRLILDFKPEVIICVGDVVSSNFLEYSRFTPHILIIDMKSLREEFKSRVLSGESLLRKEYNITIIQNPPSVITFNAWSSIKSIIYDVVNTRSRHVLIVDGEEDLLYIPAMLLAPEGSFILYGYPGEALVVSIASRYVKNILWDVLRGIGFPETFFEKYS